MKADWDSTGDPGWSRRTRLHVLSYSSLDTALFECHLSYESILEAVHYVHSVDVQGNKAQERN